MRLPTGQFVPRNPVRTPMLAGQRHRLFAGASALLRLGALAFSSRLVQVVLLRVLLLLGLLLQVVLLFVAGYLIDLGISLMELWAELARKHLELTL